MLRVLVSLVAASAFGCAHEDAAASDSTPPSTTTHARVDPCDAPIHATIVDDVAIDADRHYVVVDVAAPHPIDASLAYVASARVLADAEPPPPQVPPGPVRDAPAHPPRDVISDLIASAVAGIVDITIVPLTAVPHVLTGGNVPMVPFIEPPILQAHGSMFDDAVLDDDEWKAEVRRRAEAWERDRDALKKRNAEFAHAIDRCRGDEPCRLSGVVIGPSAVVDVRVKGCGSTQVHATSTLTPRKLPPLAATLDDDARGKGAALTEHAWGELRTSTPSWGEAFAQPSDVGAAFLSAKKSVDGDLDGDSLVCRVEAKESFDTIGQADLTARVALGFHDVAAETFVGPEDSDVFTFAVPGVHLATGDKLKISVLDRDNFSDDWVGAAATKYLPKSPLHVETTGFRADCRIRRAADEAKLRAASSKRALTKIAALARTKATATATRPAHIDREVRAVIDDVASAGGWSTPEADDVVQAYGQLRSDWGAQRARVVAARGKAEALEGALTLRFGLTNCVRSFFCTLDVVVTAPAHTRFRSRALLGGAHVVDALGRSADVETTFDEHIEIVDANEPDESDSNSNAKHDDVVKERGEAHVELMARDWPTDAEPPFTLELRDGTILVGGP